MRGLYLKAIVTLMALMALKQAINRTRDMIRGMIRDMIRDMMTPLLMSVACCLFDFLRRVRRHVPSCFLQFIFQINMKTMLATLCH